MQYRDVDTTDVASIAPLQLSESIQNPLAGFFTRLARLNGEGLFPIVEFAHEKTCLGSQRMAMVRWHTRLMDISNCRFDDRDFPFSWDVSPTMGMLRIIVPKPDVEAWGLLEQSTHKVEILLPEERGIRPGQVVRSAPRYHTELYTVTAVTAVSLGQVRVELRIPHD